MAAKKAAKKAAPKTSKTDEKPQEEKVEAAEQLFSMSVDTLLGSFEITHSAATKLKDPGETIRRFKVKSTAPIEKRYPIRIGMEIVNGGFSEHGFGMWNIPAKLIDQLARHDFNRQGKIQIVDIEY